MRSLRFALAACGLLAACGTSPSNPNDVSVASDAVDSATPTDGPRAPDAAPAPVPVTVPTPSGPVTGRDDGAVSAFLGIPYAEAPVAALRWRAPVARAAWTTPFDASQAGPACPQTGGGTRAVPPAEDCLRVNVWTPQHTATDHLPVMVFIHGGGFTGGEGSAPTYDGRVMAQRGHVVVVTINYRLGQLGFLAHPLLTAEDTAHHSSGNYGMMDQIASLRWVQSHINAFGGDPANVTIFGESAGAISVAGHVVSPESHGLFARAIAESGSALFIYQPLHTDPTGRYQSAEELGQSAIAAMGCDTAADILACARAKPVADVLAAAPMPLESLQVTRAHYMPTVDGWIIPERPWVAVREGRFNRVPVVSGANLDEGTAFATLGPVTTEAELTARFMDLVPAHVAEARAMYPVASYPSVNAAYAAFIGDALFLCPARTQARRIAQYVPQSYLYLFTRLNNWGRVSSLGVFHSAELPYVFGNFVAPFQDSMADRRVSAYVQDYWTRFGATSDPNGAGATSWAPVTATTDPYVNLGDTAMALTGLSAARCATLEAWMDER